MMVCAKTKITVEFLTKEGEVDFTIERDGKDCDLSVVKRPGTSKEGSSSWVKQIWIAKSKTKLTALRKLVKPAKHTAHGSTTCSKHVTIIVDLVDGAKPVVIKDAWVMGYRKDGRPPAPKAKRYEADSFIVSPTDFAKSKNEKLRKLWCELPPLCD